MAKKPNVYVVQGDRKKNILSALDYGDELIELLGPDDNVILNPARAVRTISGLLAKYTKDDFILPIGDPAAIGIVCSMAANITGGKFKMLKWDNQERRYYTVKVNTNPNDTSEY
jgi:ABC-type sugar transport system substrate-binding protein